MLPIGCTQIDVMRVQSATQCNEQGSSGQGWGTGMGATGAARDPRVAKTRLDSMSRAAKGRGRGRGALPPLQRCLRPPLCPPALPSVSTVMPQSAYPMICGFRYLLKPKPLNRASPVRRSSTSSDRMKDLSLGSYGAPGMGGWVAQQGAPHRRVVPAEVRTRRPLRRRVAGAPCRVAAQTTPRPAMAPAPAAPSP